MAEKVSFGAAMAMVLTALAAGVLASLAIRPPGAPAGAAAVDGGETRERLRWTVPVAFGTRLVVLGDMGVRLAQELDAGSGGAIVLEISEPGAVVPALSITDAVREGKVEAGLTWLGYDQGRIPAATLIGAVPFGMEPWEFMAWWYDGGGRELGEALYRDHRLHPILCGITGPETAGWFREPIASLEDLEGLKIRFAGLGGKVLQRVGASVTLLPGAEIFQAMEKGAIDATEFSMPAVDQLIGLERVARYNYFPGWHQTFSAYHLVVNRSLWEALRADTRGTIETACAAVVTYTLARAEALQGEVIAGFDDLGVTAAVLPREMLLSLRRITSEVLDAEAADDEDFARILASQRAFSRSYGRWKRVGYLPRDF